ncbi:SH3 domain-containing protein [Actinoplanes sp. NPDC026623]|uniref:SH3 domain-containing protein n=1 Tax=Actinoplanes sp. NPDC026623 TaxID=3155610 RepID=UPI0034039EFD
MIATVPRASDQRVSRTRLRRRPNPARPYTGSGYALAEPRGCVVPVVSDPGPFPCWVWRWRIPPPPPPPPRWAAGVCHRKACTIVAESLKVRSAPSQSAKIVGSVRNNQQVTVACVITGQLVKGTVRTTTAWDRIGTGRYVSHAYVKPSGQDPALPGEPARSRAGVRQDADPGRVHEGGGARRAGRLDLSGLRKLTDT